LTCPKKYILFKEEEGAEEHCQCGALALSNQRIFDWLDESRYEGGKKYCRSCEATIGCSVLVVVWHYERHQLANEIRKG